MAALSTYFRLKKMNINVMLVHLKKILSILEHFDEMKLANLLDFVGDMLLEEKTMECLGYLAYFVFSKSNLYSNFAMTLKQILETPNKDLKVQQVGMLQSEDRIYKLLVLHLSWMRAIFVLKCTHKQ